MLINNNNVKCHSIVTRHVVVLKVLLHYFVHQSHINHHAKSIILMLIKQNFCLKSNIITIHYRINKNGDIIIRLK